MAVYDSQGKWCYDEGCRAINELWYRGADDIRRYGNDALAYQEREAAKERAARERLEIAEAQKVAREAEEKQKAKAQAEAVANRTAAEAATAIRKAKKAAADAGRAFDPSADMDEGHPPGPISAGGRISPSPPKPFLKPVDNFFNGILEHRILVAIIGSIVGAAFAHKHHASDGQTLAAAVAGIVGLFVALQLAKPLTKVAIVLSLITAAGATFYYGIGHFNQQRNISVAPGRSSAAAYVGNSSSEVPVVPGSRTSSSMALERYVRTRLNGSANDTDVAELCDTMAARIDAADLPSRERDLCFVGTGDHRELVLWRIPQLMTGSLSTPETHDVAKQLFQELGDCLSPKVPLDQPFACW